MWERIHRRIPFTLTADQEAALDAMRRDLASGRRMTRLLHGEVGSGKTAVAFALALAVAAEGGQAAVLAPTEILARQHLRTFREWLSGAPLRVAGLLGDDGAAQRRDALESLRHGTAAIAVGTHALYGSAVEFRNLALVILDEQHRFGVKQKAALLAKGNQPHVLTMTATPIPRTLAWAQYGALEPCVLRTRPGTGGRVTTRVAAMGQWPEVARERDGSPHVCWGMHLFDARLARLLNWVLERYASVPADPPYDAREIGALRSDPLRDTRGARASLAEAVR